MATSSGTTRRGQGLARQLLKEVGTHPPVPRSASADGEGVILDIEIEGVRCLLVRPPPGGGSKAVLSPREVEIAGMIAEGYPNKTIAGVLDISPWTVSTHLRRIFAKLGVRSRAAMVTRLIQWGLIRAGART